MTSFQDYIIQIDEAKCIGCGRCVEDCPEANIRLDESVKKACIIRPSCIKCAHCVAVCPVEAVHIPDFDAQESTHHLRQTDNPPTISADWLLQTIRFKRSMRKFKPNPVSEDIIAQLLEMGRLTPTAKNAQDLEFVVIQKELPRLEQTAVRFFRRMIPIVGLFSATARGIEIDDHFFFKGAPLAIAILSKDKVSASLAAANMSLLAESHGLGILYSGFFSVAANLLPSLKTALGVGRKKVVTTLVIGHPAVKYHRSTQKKELTARYL